MGRTIREGLNATGMSLTLDCAGMSRVGISVSGTWVGTITFKGSVDGLNFSTIAVTPFASGTDVQTATGNGSWFKDVQNYKALQCVFTRTSGTAIVVMSTSIDSSYQNAYAASTALNVNTAATGATNTTTVAAQANRAWRLRTLSVTVDTTPTWAASPNVKVTDGASNIIWAGDLPAAAGVYSIPLPADPGIPGQVGGGVVNTVGNTLVITVASGAGSVKTNVNAEIHAA